MSIERIFVAIVGLVLFGFSLSSMLTQSPQSNAGRISQGLVVLILSMTLLAAVISLFRKSVTRKITVGLLLSHLIVGIYALISVPIYYSRHIFPISTGLLIMYGSLCVRRASVVNDGL